MNTRLHISLLTCAIGLFGLTKKPLDGNFMLSGRLVGTHTTGLIIQYIDINGKSFSDTSKLNNGKFRFSGPVNGMVSISLEGFGTKELSKKSNYIEILLNSGNSFIQLKENDYPSLKLRGSRSQSDMQVLDSMKSQLRKTEMLLLDTMREISNSLAKGDTAILVKSWNVVREKYLDCRHHDMLIDYAYAKAHPTSFIGPYIVDIYFRRCNLTLDSIQALFAGFSPDVKSSYYGQSLEKEIAFRSASATGAQAPNFSLLGENGQFVSLSNFKGKNVILLDFWASWCAPCREVAPKIRECYNKYHAKGLEIIGISWDSKRDPWIAAIREDSIGTPYETIGNLGTPRDFALRDLYSIASIPTLILIDKSGIILGRYRGDGEDGNEQVLIDKLNLIFSDK